MGVYVLVAMVGYVACVVLVSWLLCSERILEPPLAETMSHRAKLLAIALGPATIVLAALGAIIFLIPVLYRNYKEYR